MDSTKGRITPAELDDIMIKMDDDIDDVLAILNQIKMKMHDLKDDFKGDVADAYQEKFEEYTSQMDTIKDNLNSYINDLVNIKSMFEKIDQQNANTINAATEGLKKEQTNVEHDVEKTIKSIDIQADTSTQKEIGNSI